MISTCHPVAACTQALKAARVVGISQCAGRHHAHGFRAIGLHRLVETGEYLDGMRHGRRIKHPGSEHRFSQTGYLAILVNHREAMVDERGNLQSNRIGTNIDRSECSHVCFIYPANSNPSRASRRVRTSAHASGRAPAKRAAIAEAGIANQPAAREGFMVPQAHTIFRCKTATIGSDQSAAAAGKPAGVTLCSRERSSSIAPPTLRYMGAKRAFHRTSLAA